MTLPILLLIQVPISVPGLADRTFQCRFLGHDVPEVSFPHENDTNEMHLGWEYLRWGILKVAARRSVPWIFAGVSFVFSFMKLL